MAAVVGVVAVTVAAELVAFFAENTYAEAESRWDLHDSLD
jgi:hypothetical protein